MKKIIRYVLSGGTAAAVDLCAIYVLTDIFHIWYVRSSIIAFLMAFSVSFLLQKFWTFQNRSIRALPRQASSFFLVQICALAGNSVGIYALTEFFGLWYLLAQFVLLFLVSLINFVIFSRYVFRG